MTDEEEVKEEIKEEVKEEIKEEKNPDDMITRANAAAMRMEEANKKQEELLKKQEAMQVEKTLGGEAEAGTPQKKEDTDEDYAKKVMENDI